MSWVVEPPLPLLAFEAAPVVASSGPSVSFCDDPPVLLRRAGTVDVGRAAVGVSGRGRRIGAGLTRGVGQRPAGRKPVVVAVVVRHPVGVGHVVRMVVLVRVADRVGVLQVLGERPAGRVERVRAVHAQREATPKVLGDDRVDGRPVADRPAGRQVDCRVEPRDRELAGPEDPEPLDEDLPRRGHAVVLARLDAGRVDGEDRQAAGRLGRNGPEACALPTVSDGTEADDHRLSFAAISPAPG